METPEGARSQNATATTGRWTRGGLPHWAAGELGSLTGAGVRVAVIDSGWDRRQIDHRVLPGIGLVDPADELRLLPTDDDQDRIGHGTACTDLILRIAPRAEIVPIRVFGARLETSVDILAAALDHAIRTQARIVNLSLGTLREDAVPTLYSACERARRHGVIIVAASHASRERSYPAVFANVIGVAGTRDPGGPSYVFRSGAAIECSATQVHEQVLRCGGVRRSVDGSSFAAPVLSGIVALLLERYPDADLDRVRELLARYSAPALPGAPR